MKKQIAVIEILKNNKGLLKKYEKLKESMNGKSFREYQEKKYEFYHRILDNKIKAILFDLVGVLVFKREGYIPTTPNEINAQNIENLFNHIDDQKLLRDIKDKLDLNDGEIKKALPYIPSKFEKFDYSIFDLYINSGEIGLRKPDPKIYLLTCDKLRVKLDECLFMDDSLENIDSAKKLGMKTIWWNRNENKEKLLLELKKLLE